MTELIAFIVLAKAIVLALGGVITHLAYRAFRRTRAPALRAFAVGFGVITFGALIAGGLDQVAGFDLQVGVFVQSALTAIGFGVLAYSLYAYNESPTPATDAEPS